MADFDWKKNWKWIALGLGLLIVITGGIVAAVILTSGGGSEAEGAADGSSGGGDGGRDLGLVGGPPGTIQEYEKSALEYHNEWRKEHQAPPLELDAKLNSLADKCAKYYGIELGKIDHSCKTKGEAGENLYSRSAGDMNLPKLSTEASLRWYEEIKDYNFNKPGFDPKTGHFTAMIWKDAKRLGVGVYRSDKISVVVCLYTPHPNILPEKHFKANVLPKL